MLTVWSYGEAFLMMSEAPLYMASVLVVIEIKDPPTLSLDTESVQFAPGRGCSN